MVIKPEKHGNTIHGEIIYFDGFGNGVTNIPGAWLAEKQAFRIECREVRLDRLSHIYEDAAGGNPLALIGSLNTLELSVRGGSAKEQLALAVGDRITITFKR
jgi:S-adenosylmethionine hydrolase